MYKTMIIVDSEHHRKAFATGLKIVGGIILAISFGGLVGLIASHWMDIPHDFSWAKLVFCCGLGLANSGTILSKMGPQLDESSRKRAIIGIALLLCCTVISVFLLITGFSARIFVPLSIGLVGDIIGSGISDNKDEEAAKTTTQDNEE